jgi:anhydro-N-acetylmuramic acid kinase
MSGTSLDGVDAAMVLTDGVRVLARGARGYRPYAEAERLVLRSALGRWPGETGVEAAARIVTEAHADCLQGIEGAALVGFHGQTLAHDPKGRGTHQAGDGAALARALGLPVAWDFRTADVAAGGEGAPLAPFYHFALACEIGADPIAFLNLGGVGNLTWADPSALAPEAPGALLAFDTGPANAPIDDLVRARLGQDRDEGGELALSGRADPTVVKQFLNHPYFARKPPKSLDRNDFPDLGAAVADLSDADAAATLAAIAAASVAAGVAQVPRPAARLLVTGGGRHNAAIMTALRERIGMMVEPIEAAGLDGDMLEAEAFAFLAVRVARGLPLSAPGTTGVPGPIRGGKISPP